MSSTLVDETSTADELGVGRIELAQADAGEHRDGAGGGPPPLGPPPSDRRRGYGRGEGGLPRWQALALWGALTIILAAIAFSLGRLGAVIERGLLEERP